jgi:xanthine dehydrogenase YagT iron-sulfur-binding subunit
MGGQRLGVRHSVRRRARRGELRHSFVSLLSSSGGPIELNDDEIRERMSGNLCRCGAYVNIVAAIWRVAGSESAP